MRANHGHDPMHDHAGDERTGATRRPAPAGRDADPVTARMLALQRAAGNAAVARTVGADGPGADRSAESDARPVQRSSVHNVLSSPGRPLDGGIRSEMEAAFGTDFSQVRVHTDAAAQRSAAEIGASAYTSGEHVVVGGLADRHTLAHELTHVVQQRRGPVAGTDNGDGLQISHPDDRFEREAEATARAISSGESVQRILGG